jgi:hypothetical protein
MPETPTLLDQVKTYLADSAISYTEASVEDALTAELAAQARVCRVGDPRPDDLLQALKRRVARNLTMRNLTLGVMADDAGGIRIGSNDPEIRRFEAPFRKVISG